MLNTRSTGKLRMDVCSMSDAGQVRRRTALFADPAAIDWFATLTGREEPAAFSTVGVHEMRSKGVVAAVMITATVAVSGIAVQERADRTAPMQGYDVAALRHVGTGQRERKMKKRERKAMDSDLNKLEARIALLWARVQEIESKALATATERKTNA